MRQPILLLVFVLVLSRHELSLSVEGDGESSASCSERRGKEAGRGRKVHQRGRNVFALNGSRMPKAPGLLSSYHDANALPSLEKPGVSRTLTMIFIGEHDKTSTSRPASALRSRFIALASL